MLGIKPLALLSIIKELGIQKVYEKAKVSFFEMSLITFKAVEWLGN